MTECNSEQLQFHDLGWCALVGTFDGGMISSDGGGLLLDEVEARTHIIKRLAAQVLGTADLLMIQATESATHGIEKRFSIDFRRYVHDSRLLS